MELAARGEKTGSGLATLSVELETARKAKVTAEHAAEEAAAALAALRRENARLSSSLSEATSGPNPAALVVKERRIQELADELAALQAEHEREAADVDAVLQAKQAKIDAALEELEGAKVRRCLPALFPGAPL